MKKVIIIEDSPTFCNMLGKKLETKGWKTILCYNYRDGLKTVRESSEWDVVISDMRLGNDNVTIQRKGIAGYQASNKA